VEKSAASCNLPHFGLQIRFQFQTKAVEKSAASYNLPHLVLHFLVFNENAKQYFVRRENKRVVLIPKPPH
jgi:hypothetical protein